MNAFVAPSPYIGDMFTSIIPKRQYARSSFLVVSLLDAQLILAAMDAWRRLLPLRKLVGMFVISDKGSR